MTPQELKQRIEKQLKKFPLSFGEDYHKHDHSHCFRSEKPPCGQRIKHFECCLCKELHPEIKKLKEEIDNLEEEIREFS